MSVVLPFLGAGPESGGRVSGFHRAAVSNAFGIPASQEGALNWLWASLVPRKWRWAQSQTELDPKVGWATSEHGNDDFCSADSMKQK